MCIENNQNREFKENDIYILKKDLPNIRKGTEFIIKREEHGYLYIVAINQESFLICGIKNFDEWFEKKENVKQYQNDDLIQSLGGFTKEELEHILDEEIKLTEEADYYKITYQEELRKDLIRKIRFVGWKIFTRRIKLLNGKTKDENADTKKYW